MPELPEVETIVRDLRPELVGRTILSTRLTHDDVLRGVTRRRLLAGLRGRRIRALTRRAKHAVFDLGGHYFVVQPGMTGSLLVQKDLTADERHYAVVQAKLDDGRVLIYHDVRRLGTLLLLNQAEWDAYDAGLGPEPLDPQFTPERLRERLRGTRQAIKKALMDQRVIAGVGNIYANEALFIAGIDPSKEARAVTPEASGRLHTALQDILQAAIESKGTTVRDYRTGTGQPGQFQFELLVYEREGEPCRRCGTTLAGTHAIDARITVFCHRCQR